MKIMVICDTCGAITICDDGDVVKVCLEHVDRVHGGDDDVYFAFEEVDYES